MIKKIQYSTEQERESVLIANHNMYLIEEQNIFEGNYLILSDEQPELLKVKQQVDALNIAMANLLGV